MREKCKSALTARGWSRDVLLVCILLVASGTSYVLGYATAVDSRGQGSEQGERGVSTAEAPSAQQFVASKYGSKYYPTSCAGAKRLSTSTMITFASRQDAEHAGYSFATNCERE